MGHFLLCIDDTDDKTKSIGTGEIASHIFDRLTELGCRMRFRITRHQLLLDQRIAYTSHNSSMCMEGSGVLTAEEIWKLAVDTLAEFRSPISNPGVCLYTPADDAVSGKEWDEKLIVFGLRAKREVLSLADARRLAKEIPNLRLEAPAGNGNGQIGALAGIGLRLHGSDGTFRGKMPISEAVTETVAEMKERIGVGRIWDAKEDRILEEHEMVRAVKQVKLVYRDHEPIAAVRMCEDGIYEICNKAAIYEQTITPALGIIENCMHFQWDNDQGEQWSEHAGSCVNCLFRRLTDHGMKCTRPEQKMDMHLKKKEKKTEKSGGQGRGQGKCRGGKRNCEE